MPDPFAPFKIILWLLGCVLFYIGPFVFLYGVYVVLSIPLRRKERARLLLHLIDLGAGDGRSPERAVVEAAASRDPIMGVRFYELASWIESGVRLDDALRKVPRMVSPEIAAMIRVGCEVGDIRRVLPACRQWFKDALSHTRGALNFVAILAFIILPVIPVVFTLTNIFVMPKFDQIANDIGVGMPPLARAVFGARGVFVVGAFALMLLFQAMVFFYAAGPRGRTFVASLGLGALSDRLLWSLPWRRNRMKRDFTAMLAVTLDAGLEEQQAVRLAAESTANSVFIGRAQLVTAQLKGGAKLTDALALLDDRAELRWRVTNAQHSRRGFFDALHGWLQALDAKAFQQEQSAAQILTTALVVVNGAFIGLFVVAVFQVLVSISEEAPLW